MVKLTLSRFHGEIYIAKNTGATIAISLSLGEGRGEVFIEGFGRGVCPRTLILGQATSKC